MQNPQRFVAIRFVNRFGAVLPWIAAVVVLALGLPAWLQGQWLWGIVTVVGAVVIAAVVQLAVEVVDLVSETMLPR